MLSIVPKKVIHMPAQKCHAGLVIKSIDGIETIYAVKTKKDSVEPAEVKVKYADGWRVVGLKTCPEVTAIFAEFLGLMGGCFQKSNSINQRDRCYAILTDGLIKNRDQNAALSVKHYDGIIDGEFISVDLGIYQRRPLNLSSDWEVFEPTRQHKLKIDGLVSGINRYMSKKTTAQMLQRRRNSSTGVF